MNMAKDMRKLAEEKQIENDATWWSKYKEELFVEIKKRSISGDLQLSINKSDKINQFDFISCLRLRQKVETELKHLGYEVEYFNGSHQSDGEDRCLTIKW